MNDAELQYYRLLGIVPYELRNQPALTPVPTTESTAPSIARESKTDISHVNLDTLRDIVAQCTLCSLHTSRTQTVFGVGNTSANLMIVGEAPGMNEDLQGEPFVGRAGQLLTSMLKAIGFNREQVYIANILKCRPPNNRDPLAEEVASCTQYLDQQIALIKPQLLLAVGRVAAHYLLKTKASLESLRNRIHDYGVTQPTPLIITYHPAYLLRSPQEKKKAYADLQFVLRTLSANT